VEDLRMWNLGIERLTGLLADFSAGNRQSLLELLTRYRKTKETFAEVVAEAGAASDCRDCGGQCCLNGKYRVNVFDALARIAAQVPTSADFSQKPVCPYGTDAGCTMDPGLRPADCVLFICETIDRKLPPQAGLILAVQEQALRECLLEASVLTGEPVTTPLLLWAGKTLTKSKLKV
jgi:hypothetical protein